MSNVDTRQINRDSLFLMANVRVDGGPGDVIYRVKVRNLSSGGMMAEGEAEIMRGAQVQVELRNVGWIGGSVAWRQDNRFGIAFNREIDPLRVRGNAVAQTDFESPTYTRNAQPVRKPEPGNFRKI